MSGGAGSDQHAGTEVLDYWPSPRAFMSAYAGVVRQIWDLTYSWYDMLIEQGSDEDSSLTSGTAPTYVQQNPTRQITLDWSATRHCQGPCPKGPVLVTLDRSTVPPGKGSVKVQVSVEKQPPSVTDVHVVLRDHDDPTKSWLATISLQQPHMTG